jgi:hypothetical protein
MLLEYVQKESIQNKTRGTNKSKKCNATAASSNALAALFLTIEEDYWHVDSCDLAQTMSKLSTALCQHDADCSWRRDQAKAAPLTELGNF